MRLRFLKKKEHAKNIAEPQIQVKIRTIQVDEPQIMERIRTIQVLQPKLAKNCDLRMKNTLHEDFSEIF